MVKKIAGLVAALLVLVLVLAACGEDLGVGKYSSRPARFLCSSVVSVPALYTAVNNMGQWCTVTIDNSGKRYQFALPTSREPDYWNITANREDAAHTWIAGLIIGTPTLPEPGALASVVTCYDLVCPVCYKIPIDRRLAVGSNGIASCEACGSRYDLNNQGIGVGEGASSRLIRYRVTYMAASNRVLVNN